MTEKSEYLTFLNLMDENKASIIQSLLKQKTVKKKSYLLTENQICKQSYIVKNGIARKFYLHSDKEITTDIYLTGDFIFSLESFINQTKSIENIVAVTDLDLLYINFNEMMEAMKQYPWITEYDLMFTERYAIQLENKLRDRITLNATEHYEKILKNNPKIIQQVPLNIIASYLNISVERLSRIRASFNK
jgi:CRP-like cAMP-binding protein